MKGYIITFIALFTLSSCFFLAAEEPQQEEQRFAEKAQMFAEAIETLYTKFINEAKQANDTVVLEKIRGITALNQEVSVKWSKGVYPKKFDLWVKSFMKKVDAEDELREKIIAKLNEIQKDTTGEIFAEKFLYGNQEADQVSFIYIMGRRDQATQKTHVASAMVNASVKITERILIQEVESGEVKEENILVKPEDYDEKEIQLVKLICEYVAANSMKNFFNH